MSHIEELVETLPEPGTRLAVLEALLFLSPAPMRVGELGEICGWGRELIERDLERLQEVLAGRGIELQQIAGAVRLVTVPLAAPYAERMLKIQSRKRLSRSQLETLAVVAYKQPVTRAQVEAYRGVKSERPLSQLMELRLLREAGRAPLPGRPVQYGTTAEFLRHFGLNDLGQLPPLVAEEDLVADTLRRGPFAELGLDRALERDLTAGLAGGVPTPDDNGEDSGEPVPESSSGEIAGCWESESGEPAAIEPAPSGAGEAEPPTFHGRNQAVLDTPSEELRRLFDRIRRQKPQ